jgi:hypothetical protein
LRSFRITASVIPKGVNWQHKRIDNMQHAARLYLWAKIVLS